MTGRSLSLSAGEGFLQSCDLGWEEDQVHRREVEEDRSLLGTETWEPAGELKHRRSAGTVGGMTLR